MTDLVDALDDLIRATKKIAGTPDWEPGPRSGQQRWLASLSIGGVVSQIALVIDAYPREPSLKFSILLIYGTAIVRVDYGELDAHYNHPVSGKRLPPHIQMGWLEGPHEHSWEDNRVFVTQAPPKELEFAVPLPQHVRGFANCFRWFCGKYNIDIADIPVPDIPAKDTLL